MSWSVQDRDMDLWVLPRRTIVEHCVKCVDFLFLIFCEWINELSYFLWGCNAWRFPKGNQPLIFIWRTDAEAEALILWPPDANSHLTGKDPDTGKDWGQEEKGVTEDEMVGWHDWLNGHEFEQLRETMKDREAWCTAIHGAAKSLTQLSDWTTMPEEWQCVKLKSKQIIYFLKMKIN